MIHFIPCVTLFPMHIFLENADDNFLLYYISVLVLQLHNSIDFFSHVASTVPNEQKKVSNWRKTTGQKTKTN